MAKELSLTVAGRIDSEWANQLPEKRKEIWEYNNVLAEEIMDEIPLDRLGGLVVVCAPELFMPDRQQERVRARDAVNLAFGKVALATTTEALHNAVMSVHSDPIELLATSLRRRLHDPQVGNETWFLPVNHVEVLESVPDAIRS